MPDPDECSLEDYEEEGDTTATVVYRAAAKDDKASCGFAVVLKSDPASDRCEAPCNMRAVRHHEQLFAASKKWLFYIPCG